MEPTTFAAFLPIWLLLFVILPAQRRKKTTIIANKILYRNETEKKEMFELAKRFIEKECAIYTFDGNQYTGTIKEVTEGGVLIDRKGKTEILNLNLVIRIKEIIKK